MGTPFKGSPRGLGAELFSTVLERVQPGLGGAVGQVPKGPDSVFVGLVYTLCLRNDVQCSFIRILDLICSRVSVGSCLGILVSAYSGCHYSVQLLFKLGCQNPALGGNPLTASAAGEVNQSPSKAQTLSRTDWSSD